MSRRSPCILLAASLLCLCAGSAAAQTFRVSFDTGLKADRAEPWLSPLGHHPRQAQQGAGEAAPAAAGRAGVGGVGPGAAGTLPPHVMCGNVMEWCADLYGASYYAESPLGDPPDPQAGKKRVVRGSEWFDGPGTPVGSAARCRSAYRYHRFPDAVFDRLGFRVVREVE